MPRTNEEDFLFETIRDAEAVRFVQAVFQVSQVLDDLYDRDRPVEKDQVQRVFWTMMVEIPHNRFYQMHIQTLTPVLQTMMLDWMDSCELERQGDHEKNIAFALRDSVGALISHCAYLINGYDWMVKVSPAVRRHIFEESLEDYKGAL
jgi:hypothetical protein